HGTAMVEAIVVGGGGARHQAVLRALLAAGADPRRADRHGRTPLQLARERGHGAMVAMLEGAQR
ncbi:MAG: ankyrin repeat domain-containing protein, partial [Burkholderiales bacterium]|nr:ankyrin repeat domain-containing protein [Burkholderiales bacterium]